VELLGLGDVLETGVSSVEAFNRPIEVVPSGYNVGVLLRGVKAEDVQRGQVLAALRWPRARDC
jgi:elongation factor Tu